MKISVFEGDINQCYGCRACEQICPSSAIEMIEDEEGFLISQINPSKCIECSLCEKVCPVLIDLTQKQGPSVYAGWINDREIQNVSSSGGMFTAIAQYVIKKDGVVFGAAFNEHLKVEHRCAEKMEELAPMRGSKYVQSDTKDSYWRIRDFLKKERLVLFSGTPCQIAGLKGYLLKDYSNLITCELVCHGVPSQKLFDTYRRKVPKLNSPRITNIVFRDMKVWNFTTQYYMGNKRRFVFGKDDFFMKAFLRSYSFRERCYTCQFSSIPRVADLTIADFWGIGEKIPFDHVNRRGVSLVLVNSDRGKNVLDSIKNTIFIEPRTLEEAERKNRNIYEPSVRPPQRDTFYKDMDLSLGEFTKKYSLNPTLRNVVGFLLRRVKNIMIK